MHTHAPRKYISKNNHITTKTTDKAMKRFKKIKQRKEFFTA